MFAKTKVAKGSVISGKRHTREETSGRRLSQQTEDDLKQRRCQDNKFLFSPIDLKIQQKDTMASAFSERPARPQERLAQVTARCG